MIEIFIPTLAWALAMADSVQVPQVSRQLLLELGEEDFLAETGSVVTQQQYHQFLIRANTKIIYAQVCPMSLRRRVAVRLPFCSGLGGTKYNNVCTSVTGADSRAIGCIHHVCCICVFSNAALAMLLACTAGQR